MGADYFRGKAQGKHEARNEIRRELLKLIDDPLALIDYIKHMEV